MRIPSYYQIRNGDYPSAYVFAPAKNFVSDVLIKAHEGGVVSAAMLLGSVARGTPGMLSDMDVFVVYDERKRDQFHSLAVKLNTECQKTFRIPLEMIALSTSRILTGWHDIGPQLIGHLMMCAREYPYSIIAGDPIGLIGPHYQGIADYTLGYVLHKLRGFEKGLPSVGIMEEGRLRHVVAKAIDFPVYAGRMVLGALSLLGIDERDDAGMIKARFLGAEVYPVITMIDRAKQYKLLFLDYIDLIVKGQLTRREYDEHVQQTGVLALKNAIEIGEAYLDLLHEKACFAWR